MNPLTREVLLTLVDEASDEQIISALQKQSTSVLLFRFILKQYFIDLTSVPGTKLDHKETVHEWSHTLGYLHLEQQRKRATMTTTHDSDTNNDEHANKERYSIAHQLIPSINAPQITNKPVMPPISHMEPPHLSDGPLQLFGNITELSSSSESGVESLTPDLDTDMKSLEAHQREYTEYTVNSIIEEIDPRDIDQSLLKMKYTMSKTYDLSDDESSIMVGNVRATLFMRIWLNITEYLHQNDKLLSLQFVSKKFRMIALATNHWRNININLNQIRGEEDGLKRFLDLIHENVENVNISNIDIKDAQNVALILKCLPINIKSLIFVSSHYKLPSLSPFILCKFIYLQQLMLHGTMDCDDKIVYDILSNLNKLNTLKILCFDLNESDDYSRNEICNLLPSSIEEFWIPRNVNTEWFINCLKKNKLSNLKVLASIINIDNEMDLKRIYLDKCFDYDIFRLIADHCIDIEYISIDIKLSNDFVNTFKYLLSNCHNLYYVGMKLNIAYNVMDVVDQVKVDFFRKLADLKIGCLSVLQELSTNYKYECCTSFSFYEKNNKSHSDNDYDLQFTLFKE